MDKKAIVELTNNTFKIPYYQRGYKWTPNNVRILLEDFKNFISDECKQKYCLQPVAVIDEGQDNYTVIDGQQRLTTLFLLWKYLYQNDENNPCYNFIYDRDENDERIALLSGITEITEPNDDNIDYFYITRAFLTIKEWFHDSEAFKYLTEEQCCHLQEGQSIENIRNSFRELLKAPQKSKSIMILWYKVDGAKGHDDFRNINSGKIELSNSDLIKALLLNNTNAIGNRQQIAAQFELMERQLSEDRFWYMLQQKDVEHLKGQSRMDLLFNLQAGISMKDYQIEPRLSFYKFANYSNEDLSNLWKGVRDNYQRIKDLYDDPYFFHYIGFLTYCRDSNKIDLSLLKEILEEYTSKKKDKFKDILKEKIKKKLAHTKLNDYSFDDDKKDIRRIFVLHNIETILCRYEQLKKNLGLCFAYENFPFDLLYKQTWNIEHIASHTDNTLSRIEERKDWIDSTFADYEDELKDKSIENQKGIAESDLSNKSEFDKLFKMVVKKIVNNPISDDDKNGIGNLVLLDEHTNKYFHNALFARKRRIVIMASGLRNEEDDDCESNVQSVYAPICTQQVYTKSYNKNSGVKLNCWEQEDYDAYANDMREKLKFYFSA